MGVRRLFKTERMENARLTSQMMSAVGLKRLTMCELEMIEEAAHKSGTCEAKIVLQLSVALREALQAKENADALAAEFKRRAGAIYV